MKLSVIGTGYLGATHAAAMAELGHEVLGVDIDETKIERLAAGQVPFYEPGLTEFLAKHVASGALRFSTSVAEAGAFADLHFVCVGTPQKAGEYAADLAYVDAAFRSLAASLRAGALVVGKSTVPVGTAVRLAVLIRAAGGQLVWNPEFLREGFAVEDTMRPDRLVFGVASDWASPNGGGPRSPARCRRIGGGHRPAHGGTRQGLSELLAGNEDPFIKAMAEVCENTDVQQRPGCRAGELAGSRAARRIEWTHGYRARRAQRRRRARSGAELAVLPVQRTWRPIGQYHRQPGGAQLRRRCDQCAQRHPEGQGARTARVAPR
jgi:UDPglucose 6-dehydrogenase